MKSTIFHYTAVAVFLPGLCFAAPTTQTIVCPTAKQAYRLFKNCRISVPKESCAAKFNGVRFRLTTTTEGLYGGTHQFPGFKHSLKRLKFFLAT